MYCFPYFARTIPYLSIGSENLRFPPKSSGFFLTLLSLLVWVPKVKAGHGWEGSKPYRLSAIIAYRVCFPMDPLYSNLLPQSNDRLLSILVSMLDIQHQMIEIPYKPWPWGLHAGDPMQSILQGECQRVSKPRAKRWTLTINEAWFTTN